jgi:outer membrane biosynthesis protein TonB
MTNYQSMAASFEKEKNIKASAYTGAICVLLFLLFFFMQWQLPQIPAPTFGEGIEVNLGNSETGLGDVPPQIPGQASATEDVKTAPPQTAQQQGNQPKVNPDEYDDGDAPSVSKATKPVVKPITTTPSKIKKDNPVIAEKPTPAPPKPKALFKGGTSTTTSGNNADSYNGAKNQGIAGGKGDQGNPNGNPNSDSYKGNAASGNSGNGGTGGVSIRSGLGGRRIARLPSFEDDFNENAKVAVDITVDKAGNVTAATINLSGTTTTNQSIRAIALRKARTIKLNSGTEDEQTGTLVFNFKLRG